MPQLNDELSLRHLPDVSDSSFSFQIPGAIQGDNNLLEDDDLDFFKGADVSTIAPLATSTEPPLTVTPKPEKSSQDGRKLDSFPTLSYAHSEDHDTNPKQHKANPQYQQPSKDSTDNVNVLSRRKLNVITTSNAVLPLSQGSPALRAELNLFNDKLVAGPCVDHQELSADIRILRKSHENKKIPRNNQKVIEGGISKTRYATKLSPITSHAGTDTQKQNTMAEPVDKDYSFADSSMSSATGVAGRLVMYSQKLINSFGVLGSDQSRQAVTAQAQQASSDDQNADIPLTLSQLSPQRAAPSRDPIPTPQDDVPMSSLKRPISVGVLEKRKKSKTDATSADVSVPKPSGVIKSRLPVTRRQPKGISFNSSSGLRLNRRKSTSTRVHGPGIKRRPVFKPEAREFGVDSKETSASSSSCASTSDKDAGPVNSITSSSSHGSSRVVSCHDRQPAPLNFQMNRKGLDVREEDENVEQSESQSEKRYHIPDFKAMHATLEAERALRKENIKPVVPLPIRWETERRVKERQKFDERMRDKEREEERVEEMRRKEREEREEREVRELRKKAVPKAHEVPEWYKEAPKKKKG